MRINDKANKEEARYMKKAGYLCLSTVIILILLASFISLTACLQDLNNESPPAAPDEISAVHEPSVAPRVDSSDETSTVPELTTELQTKTKDELLGTVISVSLYSNDDKIFDDCFAAAADIDRRMTNNSPDSEISVLNQKSGKGEVSVSPDTWNLLSLAQDVSRKSNGAFDASIGVVTDLWKENGSFAKLPSDSAIQANLPLVSYKNISLIKENSIQLEKAGMVLDLGAIAKGYACDVAVESLRQNGIKNAFLDFGGNIYACGTKTDGRKWRVGVRYPEPGDSGIACVLDVSDKTVVTSGGYERYFEKEGAIYHHILDPKTGYSAKNGLKSVTIVAESSALADALSTACFVLGLNDGMSLLEKYEGCEGVFITDGDKLYITEGLSGQVQIADDRLQEAKLPDRHMV